MPMFNIPNQVWALIREEYKDALCSNPAFHSPHEGLAVIEDQFEDLKKAVFLPRLKRDPANMQKEAVQVAAMAIRFIIDCTLPTTKGAIANPTEGHGSYTSETGEYTNEV